ATNYGQGGQYDYYQPFGQVREKASGKALAALVLAIVSIFPGICFSFGAIALAIVAVILGKQELELISKGAAPKAGETFAKVGFYLGITGAVLNSLLGLAFCASSFLSRL
ncbi:MAG: hypothetical protein JNN15_03175, partial [Blastocatellia bacterium]|nr:hypothetical protein [Blastocatellia bacterium]